MNILVLDGQGGGIGRSIVESLKREMPESNIVAVGTNSAATASMVKGTGVQGATGETAVTYNAGRSDIIIAPMGAFFAYGMLGEISPLIAKELANSDACKIAIPVANNPVVVASHPALSLSDEIYNAVQYAKKYVK